VIEGKAVSDLCDKHHIHPTVLYQWQRRFFENGTVTFESKQPRSRAVLADGFTDMRKEGIPPVHCQAGRGKHELGLRPVRHRRPLFDYLSVLASDEDTGLASSDFVKRDLLIPHDVDSAHFPERLSQAVRWFRFPPRQYSVFLDQRYFPNPECDRLKRTRIRTSRHQ
jgi:transposase-like protein